MTSDLMRFEYAAPIQSLDAYIARVNQIPMLSAEEELDFGTKLFKNNDLSSAKHLIMPHLRYVVKVAKSFSGYGLSLSDLIQEGNIGLMKAVKRFNPEVGARLVTFAVYWIKAEIHEFILKNWRIVKVATTKAQRKLFFKLRSAKKYLAWFSDAEINAVANDLGVKPSDVREMESRLSTSDAAFDMRDCSSGDEQTAIPANYLEDHSLNPELLVTSSDQEHYIQSKLSDALHQLDARSADIIQQRWLTEKKTTLHELAAIYSISAERVRQLEKVAIKALQEAMSASL
jgi:RNA polymerase sigma-32 factor